MHQCAHDLLVDFMCKKILLIGFRQALTVPLLRNTQDFCSYTYLRIALIVPWAVLVITNYTVFLWAFIHYNVYKNI